MDFRAIYRNRLPWPPVPGTPVEVRVDYPIPAGSVRHFCWKSGTVTAAAVLEDQPTAEVAVPVGNTSTTYSCSDDDVRPPAPPESYISNTDWQQHLQPGNTVDVLFKGAWCPATVVQVEGRGSPKLLLHGHLDIMPSTQETSMRHSMRWARKADGMWDWMHCEAPCMIVQLLTRRARSRNGQLQETPRGSWMNVRRPPDLNMPNSRVPAACSLPPVPSTLPAHVPPDMAHVPVVEAEHVVHSSTGMLVTSFLPAVLARLSDMATASMPVQQNTNFTPEQCRAVVTHLGLSDSLVAQVDSMADFQMGAGKRTHMQATADRLDVGSAGTPHEGDVPAQACKRMSLGSSRHTQTVHGGAGDSAAAGVTTSLTRSPGVGCAIAAAASTAPAAAAAAAVLAPQQAATGVVSVQPPYSRQLYPPAVCPGADSTPATMQSAVCGTDDCVAAAGMSALHVGVLQSHAGLAGPVADHTHTVMQEPGAVQSSCAQHGVPASGPCTLHGAAQQGGGVAGGPQGQAGPAAAAAAGASSPPAAAGSRAAQHGPAAVTVLPRSAAMTSPAGTSSHSSTASCSGRKCCCCFWHTSSSNLQHFASWFRAGD